MIDNSLSYNGHAINERNEMLSLTDMWRAAGGDPSKAPKLWLQQDGPSEFISYISDLQKVAPDYLLQVVRGRNGGTWAHWQVGLAYAKYLSHEFHAWCNDIVRAHMEGRAVPVQASTAMVAVDTDALRAAMLPLVEMLKLNQDQTYSRLGCVESDVVHIKHEVACLRSEMRDLSHRGRRRIKDSTKGEIVRHVGELGGRCPCCGLREVVTDRRPAAHAEFDHFYANSAPDADHVWLICTDCHAELTRHVAKRDERNAEFQAFQAKRRRLPGAQLRLIEATA